MSTSDTTAETRRIVETLYRCGTMGDMSGALALVADDVVLREPAYLPFGGTYKGKQGFIDAFTNIVEHYVALPKLAVQRLIVEGEHAFGVLRVPAVAGGDVEFAEEFTVRGGKIVEIALYYHDAASLPLRMKHQ